MLDSVGLVVTIVVGAVIIGAITVWAFRRGPETGFAIAAFALLGTIALAAESGSEFGLWIRFVVVLAIASGATIVYLTTRR